MKYKSAGARRRAQRAVLKKTKAAKKKAKSNPRGNVKKATTGGLAMGRNTRCGCQEEGRSQKASKATSTGGQMTPQTPKTEHSKAKPYTGQGGKRTLKRSIKNDVTGGVKTKAGTYKTFKKSSAAAKDFRSTFAIAKKKGYKTFTWNGKKYSTKTK